MNHEIPSLADRWSRLRIRTKAFVVGTVYLLAMAVLSEVTGEGVASLWFATALPVGWCGGLLLHWASKRTRPSLEEVRRGSTVLMRTKPILFAAYAMAALVIEAVAVSDAVKSNG